MRMKIEYTPVRELRSYPNNARTHSKKQIRQIANSIAKFGFCNPVLIDDTKQIIAGHGRVEAAKLLGIDTVARRAHEEGHAHQLVFALLLQSRAQIGDRAQDLGDAGWRQHRYEITFDLRQLVV